MMGNGKLPGLIFCFVRMWNAPTHQNATRATIQPFQVNLPQSSASLSQQLFCSLALASSVFVKFAADGKITESGCGAHAARDSRTCPLFGSKADVASGS